MKNSSRMYKAGRSSRGWIKLERVTDLAEIKQGDILVMDSHWFKASNLIKVGLLRQSPAGFIYNYATEDGQAIASPVMFAHEFELKGKAQDFFQADRRK